MNILICDRCRTRVTQLKRLQGSTKIFFGEDYYCDLCQDCSKELKKWCVNK